MHPGRSAFRMHPLYFCCTHEHRKAFLPNTSGLSPTVNSSVYDGMPVLGGPSTVVQNRDRVLGRTKKMLVVRQRRLARQLHPTTHTHATT